MDHLNGPRVSNAEKQYATPLRDGDSGQEYDEGTKKKVEEHYCKYMYVENRYDKIRDSAT